MVATSCLLESVANHLTMRMVKWLATLSNNVSYTNRVARRVLMEKIRCPTNVLYVTQNTSHNFCVACPNLIFEYCKLVCRMDPAPLNHLVHSHHYVLNLVANPYFLPSPIGTWENGETNVTGVS